MFLPALHLQHASKLAQQTSAAAHVWITATGRPSSPKSQASVSSSTTWVRTSACSLASSSHKAGRAFTKTTARLTALPSPPTDDCLLASTWDYAGTTRHATPSLQDTNDKLPTLMASNIALWLEKQVPGTIVSAYCDTSAGQPRPYVSASLSPQVFQSSSPSQSTRNTHSVHHVHSPHASTPTQHSPPRGG
jgi:hypothetical protein